MEGYPCFLRQFTLMQATFQFLFFQMYIIYNNDREAEDLFYEIILSLIYGKEMIS